MTCLGGQKGAECGSWSRNTKGELAWKNRSPKVTQSRAKELLMSDDSLPASNGRYKPLHLIDENLSIREVYGVLRVGDPFPPPPVKAPKPPAKPRRRREERKSGLWAVVHAAR